MVNGESSMPLSSVECREDLDRLILSSLIALIINTAVSIYKYVSTKMHAYLKHSYSRSHFIERDSQSMICELDTKPSISRMLRVTFAL